MCMNMSAAKLDAGMTDDMPKCGMKMGSEGMRSERGGGELHGSMGEGGMSGMADEKWQAGKLEIEKVEDPVSHMPADPYLAERSPYKGKNYYSWSAQDKQAFEKDQEKHLKKDERKP